MSMQILKNANAGVISVLYQLPNFLAVKAILYPVRASIFNVGVLLCSATLLLAIPLIANTLFAATLLHFAVIYLQCVLFFKCLSKFCSWCHNECYRYDVDTTTLVISKRSTLSESIFEGYNKPTDALVSEGVKVVEWFFQVSIEKCIHRLLGINPMSKIKLFFWWSSIEITKFRICKGVTILDSQFSECTSITELNIAEDVIIGDYAFYRCTGMTVLDIAKDVVIGNHAFTDCIGITKPNIAEGVTIGDYAFYRCTGITELNISEGVTIGNYAFCACTGITELNISEGVTIGYKTFWECTGIAELNISEVVTVGSWAFSGCTGITELSISEGLIIGRSAFISCAGITKLNIAKDAVISHCAFARCTGITELNIAEGVTIGECAFLACRGMTKLNTFRHYEFFNRLPENCRVVRRALSFLPVIGASLNTPTYTIAERSFINLIYMLANRLRSNGSGLELPNELWGHIIRHCRVEYLPKVECRVQELGPIDECLNVEEDAINQYNEHCRQYM